MKTRNSIRAEVIALYKNKVIKWLSESVKTQKPIEGIRIFLGAPTKEEDILKNKEEFVAFCEDWHKDIISGKVDFLKKKYPEIGEVEVPIHLVFEKIDDIATWAGHLVEFHSAQTRLLAIKEELPELIDSGIEHINSLTTMDDDDFSRFVAVCKWLCHNKNSHALIRQIPVRGVDTRWFEEHRFYILNLMRKYLELNPLRKDLLQLGLVPPPQTVRIVLLDKALRSRLGGLRDIGLTVSDLAKLDIAPRKVIFFDDLSTALSLPDVQSSVAIALPSRLSDLCTVPWITAAQTIYMSGIQMRSFAILNNLRVYLPNTECLTLNKDVFIADRDLWSFDDIEIEELNSSMALTMDETILYNMLAAGVFGTCARLPQERMPLSQIFDLLKIPYKVEAASDNSNNQEKETDDNGMPRIMSTSENTNLTASDAVAVSTPQ